MIKVLLGKEVHPGKWEYSIGGMTPPLKGVSRQPLLDACRQIKRTGASTGSLVGLFREGRTIPDLTCELDVGAETTVKETPNGPKFAKWHPFDRAED